MVLQVQNISKYYGSQQVIKNISFTINKGEIVGFLGPNGAGKSTTMKIISGCIPYNEGRIMIKGNDFDKNPIHIKRSIGFLPENNPLYEEMYIAEYLKYVAGLYLLDHKTEKINTVIKQTGLTSEINKKIEQLSKGYKQRVGLAQALIHNPDLLILDEPTSGLDPNQMEEIHQLLLTLSPDKGILFSSHTLSEVATICTRILFIHKGEIVADIPQKEISNLESLFKELTRET